MPRIESSFASDPRNWPQVYIGVFLTTLATLLLELALTRIFSVVFYYHFAFLAISIALFGLGAGGVFSYVLADWPGRLFTKVGVLSGLNGLVVLLSLAFILSRRGEFSNLTLGLVYFASALPFFVAGSVLSLVISETIQRVDRVYFFDLLGAASGCMILLPFLNSIGGPNTVVAAGVLYAAAAAIWFNISGWGTGRAVTVVLSLLLTALVVYDARDFRTALVEVRYAKGQELTGEEFVKWNGLSRIAMAPDRGAPNMTSIIIDADAATGIANFDFDHLSDGDRETLSKQGPGLVHSIRPGAKTLIIGAGGGWDVARALAQGSKDVTAVEINPIIANTIMRNKFADRSRRLYFRPELRVEVEDGRSFVRRSTEKYRVLQATLVDTWASTAAGAFALSENNLYTTDAFYDYLQHLDDDGVLSFTRWGFDPPRESLRLLALARVALDRLGQTDAAAHVIVAREGSQQLRGWGATDTVLISRKPFTADDLERAKAAMARSNMEIVYLPGREVHNPFYDYLHATNPATFERLYRYDISPVNDNRPFFFYTVQPRDLLAFLESASRDSADYKINRAVPLLYGLMGISIAATGVILALPPLILGVRLPREKGVLRFLGYFVAIGAGYILIQVALIQKFVLFLGHPTYALTVIIFSMLVSSGWGSFTSRRFVSGSDARLLRVLVVVCALVILLALIVTPLTTAGVGWPLWLKIPFAAMLVVPVGFAMGVPFPSGLARLEAMHHPSVRWAWSLNAAASVLGSASAIFLALYIGLGLTLVLGGVLYLAAALAIRISPATPA